MKQHENIYPLRSQPRLLRLINFSLMFFLSVPLYHLYLCKLLQPEVVSMPITKDTFTFIIELEEVREYLIFLISFDVCSLFANIPLNLTIELALDHILSENNDINISRKSPKNLFQFATSETHFYFVEDVYE